MCSTILRRTRSQRLAYVGSEGVHLTRSYEYNQVHSVPLSQNPYKPGEVIGPNDCSTSTTPSGVHRVPHA